jgi:hypothetical protein
MEFGTRRGRRNRAVVDDAPAPRRLRLHGAEGRLDAIEHPAQVGVDHLPPVLDGQVLQRHARRKHARVVEQQVHPAPSTEHGVEQVLNRGRIGHIGGHDQRASRRARMVCHSLQGLLAAPGEGHVPARVQQRQRHDFADAAAGAGHDGCLGGRAHPLKLLKKKKLDAGVAPALSAGTFVPSGRSCRQAPGCHQRLAPWKTRRPCDR